MIQHTTDGKITPLGMSLFGLAATKDSTSLPRALLVTKISETDSAKFREIVQSDMKPPTVSLGEIRLSTLTNSTKVALTQTKKIKKKLAIS